MITFKLYWIFLDSIIRISLVDSGVFQMSHNTRFKRELLIFYLDKYLQKKNLKMKDFMQNIRFKLLQRNKISLRQFESILEFLKREDAFKAASDQKIINYFRPLITGLTKETETYEPATISEFQLQTN